MTLLMTSLKLAWQRMQAIDALAALLFLLMLLSLFALGQHQQLELLAPTALWMGVLIATILGCQTLLTDLHQQGVLSVWAAEQPNLAGIVMGQVMVRIVLVWLALVLGIIIGALWFQLNAQTTWITLLGVTLALPAMALLVTWSGTLILGLKQGAWVLFIIVMPLLLPILLFGIRLTEQAMQGVLQSGPLYLLTGVSLLAAALLPWAIAWSVRLSVEH